MADGLLSFFWNVKICGHETRESSHSATYEDGRSIVRVTKKRGNKNPCASTEFAGLSHGKDDDAWQHDRDRSRPSQTHHCRCTLLLSTHLFRSILVLKSVLPGGSNDTWGHTLCVVEPSLSILFGAVYPSIHIINTKQWSEESYCSSSSGGGTRVQLDDHQE